MEPRVQPVECGPRIFDFADPVIVLTLAQSRSAKVEAQHGKSKAVQRFHGVKDDFVMQSSAKQRMRMTDDRSMSRVLRAGVEQRFQSSNGAIEKE